MHAVNEKAERAPIGIQFFLFGEGLGWDCFAPLLSMRFQCVPIIFPWAPYQVPKGFSKFLGCSRRRSWQHLRFVPYGLPKSNSLVYKLKRWMSGGPHLFLVCNCAQRGASVGECPLFQKKLVMGQSKWLSLKTHKQKKKIKGVRPPLNYNEENIGKRVDDGRFFSISCSLPKVLLLYCT